MAQVVRTGRLIDLVREAAATGAVWSWLDPKHGLVCGKDLGRAEMAVDLGREALVSLPTDVSPHGGRNSTGDFEPRRAAGEPIEAAASETANARRGRVIGVAGETPPPPPRPADRLPAAIWPDSLGGRRTGDFRLTLEGRTYAASSQKQLLHVALNEIERLRPGTLLKLSRERARTKRVVARNRADLNEDQKLANRFSEPLGDGWWIFTNNSFPETEKFIRRAAWHAGLHVEIEKMA